MKQGQCLREQESPEAHGNVFVWLGEDTPRPSRVNGAGTQINHL